MAKTLNIKKYDMQPHYFAKLVDMNGAVDLTGASIVCTMKNQTTGNLKIDRQSAGIVIAADQVANKGEFEYQWQAGDTDTCADFNIEFEITPSIGGKFTIPSNNTDNPAIVKINECLDLT